MKKAISKAAVTIAATLTSGALAYAARADAVNVTTLVFVVACMFGFLAFVLDSES